jgi:putative two-component system response regulator
MSASSKIELDIASIEQQAKKRLAQRLPDNNSWFSDVASQLLLSEESPASAKEVIEAHILCMLHFYSRGDRVSATELGEHALSLSVSNEHPSLERKICNMLSVFYSERSSPSKAMQYSVRGISIARRLGDKSAEASTWGNLSSAVLKVGLYEECIKYSRRALALAGSADTRSMIELRVQASQLIARASRVLGRTNDALVSIRNATSQLRPAITPLDYLNRVRVHHCHAAISLEAEQFDEAEKAAIAAAADAISCLEDEGTVLANVANAIVHAARGNYDQADAITTSLVSSHGSIKQVALDLFQARMYVLTKANRTDDALSLRDQYHKEWKTQKIDSVLDQLSLFETRPHGGEVSVWSGTQIRARLEEFAVIGELHDDSTGEHAYRVGKLSALLAIRLGHDLEYADTLDVAARLHDIGKVSTPPQILLKAGSLTTAERETMQEHAAAGERILGRYQDPLSTIAATIAAQHHECWDGSGYPNGLKGDEISKVAQISALADVFDALTHARCYKVAWPIEKALDEIAFLSSGLGKRQHFNKDMGLIFVTLIRELVIEHGHDGLDEFLAEKARKSAFGLMREALSSSFSGAASV